MKELSPGMRVGAYVIVERIESGRGRVVRATGPEGKVALKILGESERADPKRLGRFQREANLMRDAAHPHIVPVLDVIEDENGTSALVMPLLDGPTLLDVVHTRGALPATELAVRLAPICEAVAHLHARGVLHRDVKPENIVFDTTRGPMLIDLGIAWSEQEENLTQSGSLLGTIAYMAPELTRGAKYASAASDVYALGATLFHAAAGAPPFAVDARFIYKTLAAIVNAPVVVPAAVAATALGPALEKSLAKDPADRPSALELAHALRKTAV